MRLFGVALDSLSEVQLVTRIERWLLGDRYRRIATVNPEFLVRAENDVAFRKNLQSADLRLIDGFGIILTGWLRKKKMYRITGVDVMEMLLRIADERGLSIFLATRADGLSSYEETRTAILSRYPSIRVEGVDINSADFRNLLSEIYHQKSTIILCNFGAPEQEYFLESLRTQETSFCIAVGVGSAFDYLTGKKRRAPQWMRSIGLEWLWRLVHNPQHIGRIWRATAVFLFCILRAHWKTRKMKRPPR